MIEFKESKFYKLLQDFFINNDKETFLQMLAEFYNRTESIINKNISQDELIKELRELYLDFNEKGIDENIVREKVNYFLENNVKIKNILAKLVINTNKIEDNTEKLNINTNNIKDNTEKLNINTNKIKDNTEKLNINTNNIKNISSQLETKASKTELDVERRRIDSFTKLEEGSSTGDAELIDARIGIDAIAYNNVGEAIRKQLKNGCASSSKIVSEFIPYFVETHLNVVSTENGTNKVITSNFEVGKTYLLVSDNIEKINQYGTMNKSYGWEKIITHSVYNGFSYGLLTATSNTKSFNVIYKNNITESFSHTVKMYEIDDEENIEYYLSKITDTREYTIDTLEELSNTSINLKSPMNKIFEDDITVTKKGYIMSSCSVLGDRKYLIMTTSNYTNQVGVITNHVWQKTSSWTTINSEINLKYAIITTDNAGSVGIVPDNISSDETQSCDLIVFDITDYNKEINNNILNVIYSIRNETKNILDIFSDIKTPYKRWKNKKWYVCGDSITENRKYQQPIADILELASYKTDGNPGQAISGCVSKIIADTSLLNEYDLLTIFAGTNDFGGNKTLGDVNSTSDETTTYGSLKQAIEVIQQAHPLLRIVLITPLPRGKFETQPGYGEANSKGHKLIDYVNAVKTVGELYNIPVLDLYNLSGFNKFNISTFMNDNLHPNEVGNERMYPIIANFLEKL